MKTSSYFAIYYHNFIAGPYFQFHTVCLRAMKVIASFFGKLFFQEFCPRFDTEGP